MLKARLYEVELQKREAANSAQYDSKTEIGWGHQIRSYVLQPYQMIKDLRTGVERTDSGLFWMVDLDDFLHASLALKLGGGSSVLLKTFHNISGLFSSGRVAERRDLGYE